MEEEEVKEKEKSFTIHSDSLARKQKSQLISIHSQEDVLNSSRGWRTANHRSFNGKTKGVKVIFHNFASAFYCSDTMNVNEEESSPISFPFGLLASPSNVNICK